MPTNNATAAAEPVYAHADVTCKLKAAARLALGRAPTASELVALVVDSEILFMIECRHEYARNREAAIAALRGAVERIEEVLLAAYDSDFGDFDASAEGE